jgi:hypothetical protein
MPAAARIILAFRRLADHFWIGHACVSGRTLGSEEMPMPSRVRPMIWVPALIIVVILMVFLFRGFT